MMRPLLAMPAFCGLLLATSCKKDSVAPTVGDVRINFPSYNPSTMRTYSLYTEAGWAGPNFALPLRRGTITASTTPQAGFSLSLVIPNLNAGNYVFSLDNSRGMSVQVTAGTTNDITSTL